MSSIRSQGASSAGLLPVLRRPRLDHRVDLLAVAEPAIEVLVDGDGDVGGEHEARDRLDLLALAGACRRSGRGARSRRRRRPPAGRPPGAGPRAGRKLVMAPSPFSTARLRASCRAAPRAMIGILVAGRGLELEAALAALARQGRAQEVDRLARPSSSGRSNGIPFQPSTIRSEEAPMPSAKRPARGVGQRRRLLGQQRPAPLHHADHAGAEPRPSRSTALPQRQRREAVGPVGLARPDVGVAGRLCALDSVLAAGERRHRQRQRQSPAVRRRRDPT